MKTIGLSSALKEGTPHGKWYELKELKNKDHEFSLYRDETGKLYKSKSISKMLKNYFTHKELNGELVR